MRDPRRLLGRRRQAIARVTLCDDGPRSSSNPDGSVTSKQVAEVTLPHGELERVWSAEYLERLARTYWRYLTRISLGLLRVLYTADAREVVLVARPLVLLRFHSPEYEATVNRGAVTWRINRGLLVAPAGRGRGFLRITVERAPEPQNGEIAVTVSSEVSNFYPLLASWGWFSRIGRVVYRETQLRIHVIVTHGFLRSLANLDLAPSVVGALREGAASPPDGAARPPDTAASPPEGPAIQASLR